MISKGIFKMKNEKLNTVIDNTMVTIEQVSDLVRINDDMVEDLFMARGRLNNLKDPSEKKLATELLLNSLDDKLNKMITTHDIIVDMLKARNSDLNDTYINGDNDVKGDK